MLILVQIDLSAANAKMFDAYEGMKGGHWRCWRNMAPDCWSGFAPRTDGKKSISSNFRTWPH